MVLPGKNLGSETGSRKIVQRGDSLGRQGAEFLRGEEGAFFCFLAFITFPTVSAY